MTKAKSKTASAAKKTVKTPAAKKTAPAPAPAAAHQDDTVKVAGHVDSSVGKQGHE